MPMFIVLVAVFVAGAGYSFYPEWPAFAVIPFVVFLLWAANRVRIDDRKRMQSRHRPYTHPKLDNGPALKPLNPDPAAGDDAASISRW